MFYSTVIMPRYMKKNLISGEFDTFCAKFVLTQSQKIEIAENIRNLG